MLEVLKSLAPMILAVVFVYTASVFASMGIKKKGDRRVAFVGAIAIEAVSFSIWVPCFSDLFNAIGLIEEAKQTAMIIAIILVLFGTVIATVYNLKQIET